MVELPLEIRDFSTVLATQNQVSEPHFIACLLGKFMDSHKATLGFATYPILEQLVDQLQDIDIQRVTPVNGNVNAPVNGGLLPKTQENVGSVNAPKNIEEVILPIMVALKIPQLLRNVQSLINYPINEKRTFSRFNQDELSSILFYGFEDRSITQISEKFALLLDIQDKKWF